MPEGAYGKTIIRFHHYPLKNDDERVAPVTPSVAATFSAMEGLFLFNRY